MIIIDTFKKLIYIVKYFGLLLKIPNKTYQNLSIVSDHHFVAIPFTIFLMIKSVTSHLNSL